MDERDAVPLEQDPPDLPPRPLPEVQLGGLVHHHVHELVETGDDSLEAEVLTFEEPDADALPVLEEAVEERGRQDRGRPLDHLGTTIGHFADVKIKK